MTAPRMYQGHAMQAHRSRALSSFNAGYIAAALVVALALAAMIEIATLLPYLTSNAGR